MVQALSGGETKSQKERVRNGRELVLIHVTPHPFLRIERFAEAEGVLGVVEKLSIANRHHRIAVASSAVRQG
jgi:hypothetical protein